MHRLRHPIRSVTEPFGKAGLTVAILALVMALVGGAYAAGGLTKSQEKQVKKIAKKFAGKPGAAGPQGPQGNPGPAGPTGPKGDQGLKGDKGDIGNAGESVTITPLSAGQCNNGEAGAKFSNLTGTAEACNGTNGSAGEPELPATLPSGETETGTISGKQLLKFSGEMWVPISIPIPLPEPLTKVHVINGGAPPSGCAGSVEEPAAEEGNFCLFILASENVNLGTVGSAETGSEGMGTMGGFFTAVNPSAEEKEAFVVGTWAVTAE